MIKITLTLLLLIPLISVANPGAWMPEAKNIDSIIIEGDDNGRALLVIEGGVPSSYIPEACRVGANSRFNTIFNTPKGKAL